MEARAQAKAEEMTEAQLRELVERRAKEEATELSAERMRLERRRAQAGRVGDAL